MVITPEEPALWLGPGAETCFCVRVASRAASGHSRRTLQRLGIDLRVIAKLKLIRKGFLEKNQNKTNT